MADLNKYLSAIEEINKQRSCKDLTFAEFIAQVMKDKLIEVYIGDTYEDLKSQDSTTKINAVVCGRVKAAYAECLILDCAYVDQASKKVYFGNIVCLNERSIRTLTEVDNIGTLKDTFLSSKDTLLIKKFINHEGK